VGAGGLTSRTIRYREIADRLRIRIGGEEFAPGDLLPSEALLSAEYSASRVTIRKALDVLRDLGLVDSRQGFGWFIAASPLPQTLTSLSTIGEQLAGLGIEAERRVLSFAFVDAAADIEQLLGVSHVLRVARASLADGQPFARVVVWCPADLAAELSRADIERQPFVELLEIELGGATQTIGADAAGDEDAEVLHIPQGSPILRVRRVTYAKSGTPVLVAEHTFAGHRTEFVVDLPLEPASWVPAGLRLVQ